MTKEELELALQTLKFTKKKALSFFLNCLLCSLCGVLAFLMLDKYYAHKLQQDFTVKMVDDLKVIRSNVDTGRKLDGYGLKIIPFTLDNLQVFDDQRQRINKVQFIKVSAQKRQFSSNVYQVRFIPKKQG